MTREEMCEAIQRVGVLLDAFEPSKPNSWRKVGTAQGLLANVLAALEAIPTCACGNKEPLAVVKGVVWRWPVGDLLLTEVSGNVSLYPDREATDLGGERVPVTIIILPAGEAADE